MNVIATLQSIDFKVAEKNKNLQIESDLCLKVIARHSWSTNELARCFGYESTNVLAAVSSSSGIMLTGNQSSQIDLPVAYKLVGVDLEKQ